MAFAPIATEKYKKENKMINQRDTIKVKDLIIRNNVIYQNVGGRLKVCRSLKYVTKSGDCIAPQFVKDLRKEN